MLVLSECAAAVMVGAFGGIVATAVGAKLVMHILYGVAPTDWVSFAWAILTITMVAAIAVLVPATHAVRTDPVKALRSVG
jgi:ABC-type antimicrobial peptide transport system permease subunit